MKTNPEINQFNLNSGVFSKHKGSIYNTQTWHKIEVENAASFTRNKLLRIIMNFVHPLDFIPVCFELNNGIVSFLLKNCGAAIEKICKQNLIIPNPHDANLPFKLKIILNFASAAELKIAIQPNIKSILNTKRFNFSTGVLDLDNFSQEPDLIEFCTLSQPKQMFYILHLSRNLPIKTLKLSNNEIEVLKPLEALFGMKSVASIDLRNNKISSGELGSLEGLIVTDLYLDGNPLCDEFDELSYQKACKQVCPNLERLDGCTLTKSGTLNFRRNFLCTPLGQDLVEQFLEHYFTLYDARDRSILEGIYHKDAMFSLTSTYLSLQSTSLGAKLGNYKKMSRNIKMMSDFSKNYETLFRGPAAILRTLCSLPPSEHDPYSFAVDLMSYTEKTAVLSVTGVFREIADNLLESDRILGFSRIFVLMQGPNTEYTIINEQVNISNATTMQSARAFKLYKGPKLTRQIQIPKPQGAKDQLDMAEAVKSMTGLNMEWSTKFLEECNYDMAKTLGFFVDVFKLDKLPEEAFREPEYQKIVRHPESPIVPITPRPPQEFIPQNKIPVTTRENPNLVTNIIGNSNRAYKTDQNRKRVLEVRKTRQNESRPSTVQYDPYNEDNEQETYNKPAIVILDSEDDSEDSVNDKLAGLSLPLYPLEPFYVTSPHGIFEDYEPFAYNNIFNAKRIKEGLKPATTDVWAAVETLTTLKDEFSILRGICVDPTNQKAYVASADKAMEIVKKYSYHIASFQLLLLWYYPRHMPLARELCKRIQDYIQANPRKCISKKVFDILLAECECVYGNIKLGESIFTGLTENYPDFIPPYIGYVRFLMSRERFDDARSFLSKALINPKVDAHSLRKLIKKYQDVMKCNVLS